MKHLSIFEIFGRILLGAPLIISIIAMVYGILFEPAFAAAALVSVATFGICNLAYYLSPVHQ